jgi:nucleotide-binding universal stress UspA family protein
MKRRSILVPLDGSELAEAALPYASALARATGCGIELLAVVDELGADDYANRLEALLAEGLGSHLRHAAERLRVDGVEVDTCVRRGDPAENILLHAEKRRARAVVMTTRGLGGLDRWLLGSVADGVIRLARCPVLAVSPTNAAPAIAAWKPRRLLVPLDGSSEAEQALDFAFELGAAFQAEIVLARVQPWVTSQMAIYGGYVPDIAHMDERAAESAAEYLHGIRDTASAGVSVRDVVLRGDPAERLIALAEADAIDLIIMTSHGRRGLGRLLLGSVADRIIRHGLPTMVVHPTPPTVDGARPDEELAPV